MTILVTGAAGFIGSHLCNYLLERGEQVLGVDDLNSYYDPSLKRSRLERLLCKRNFSFHQGDIANRDALTTASKGAKIVKIVHLAAQAGVRYSLENPRAYIHSNISGHLEVLEFSRSLDTLDHLVYASSSSVYGGNYKTPFSENDSVDNPVSLYAATKKADELLSYSYSHLFQIPQTGLRFFTVYGPWGRPDMACWIFTKAIFDGTPIKVFNDGEMWRDFTYIDDIVEAIGRTMETPPLDNTPPCAVYNIGNSNPENLNHFIDTLESIIGRRAVRINTPMQPGDMLTTYADVSSLQKRIGFQPSTSIEDGLHQFILWYRHYHSIV